MNRAYALLEIKSVDEDQRIIEGIASTPSPDRGGDVMEPKGAKFTLPLPLLWQHKQSEPIGEVFEARITPTGIHVKARIARINEPGRLKDRIDEAWQSLKAKLVRGLSIGYLPDRDDMPTFNAKSGGLYFRSWIWAELSAVTVPQNVESSIVAVKYISDQEIAALGTDPDPIARPSTRGRVPVVRASVDAHPPMKTIKDQIQDFTNTRAAKDAERNAIMTKAAETGETLDEANGEKHDTLTSEIAAIDKHLARLRVQEASNAAAAVEVKGANIEEAARSRGGRSPIITVRQNLPPGIEFSRAILCKMFSYLHHVPAFEVAKQRYPDNPRIQMYLKATVAAGTTTDTDWATELVEPTSLAAEFIEFLRPQTIVGKFGQGNVPDLRRVPFNIRMVGQTTGGTANWVGQAKPKPLTKFHFNATTLTWAKIAAISVVSDELARFSSPNAETIVRDALAEAVVEKMDTDFIDPAVAAVANVSPASITNGVTALSSAGTSADNIRTDIQTLLEQFILNNHRTGGVGLVLIMPETLALAASIMVNSLGQREFPELGPSGGTLLGIPVITSQYAANEAQYGNLVIAVAAREIFLSDDGQVSIDVSREAALEMLDSGFTQDQPTGASLVSLWQNNLLGIKAERYINWAKRRSTAVSYMDDVNWGAVGSPV